MRNLKRRLEELKRKNPYLSTYVLLAEAITGTKYDGDTKTLIELLVSRDEYSKTDLKGLAEHLKILSKMA